MIAWTDLRLFDHAGPVLATGPTSPRVLALPDGTFVGVGDTHTDGDAMLFGARGTSAWRSETKLAEGVSL